jgi:hypothetical protein
MGPQENERISNRGLTGGDAWEGRQYAAPIGAERSCNRLRFQTSPSPL